MASLEDLAPPGAVLLTDSGSTPEEVRALARLWSPNAIVGVRGVWACGAGLGWEDPCGSRSGRVSVDAVLPGTTLVPLEAYLGGWPGTDQPADRWLRASRRCRQDGFELRGARVRQACLPTPLSGALATERLMLPVFRRTPMSWREMNDVALPFAEAAAAHPHFPPGRHVAVAGAQRSGTTWLARCFGLLEGVAVMSEQSSFDMLVDDLPPPVRHEGTTAWQVTFLTACPGLLGAAAERALVVGIVRDPAAIVWSMLHNWDDALGYVGRMVARVRRLPAPASSLTAALLIVESAWRALDAVSSGGRVLLVEYEALVQDPAPLLAALAAELGRPPPALPPHVERAGAGRGALLDADTTAAVRACLGELHGALLARCLRP